MSGIKTTERIDTEDQGEVERDTESENVWIGLRKTKRCSAAVMSCGTPVIEVGPYYVVTARLRAASALLTQNAKTRWTDQV